MDTTGTATLITVPLTEIRWEDTTFDFRGDTTAPPALEDSIRTLGVLQPMILRREEANYTILAGFRRARICRRLSLDALPATVFPADTCAAEDAARIAVTAFTAGEHLSVARIARLLAVLRDRVGLTRAIITQEFLPLVGLGSQAHLLDNYLRIAALPAPLPEFLDARTVSYKSALPVCDLSPEAQRRLGALIAALQPGGHKIREAAILLFEVSRLEGQPDTAALDPAITAPLLDAATGTTSQRWDRFMDGLRRRRLPTWDAQRQRIDALVRDLGLSDCVSFRYPPFMEGSHCECRIRFQQPQELAAAAAALAHTADSEGLRELTEML